MKISNHGHENYEKDLNKLLDLTIKKYYFYSKELESSDKLYCGISCFLEDTLYVKHLKEKASAHIGDYLNRFNVNVGEGLNEIKSVYWVGISLSQIVENKHKYFVQDMMLQLLSDMALIRIEKSKNFLNTSEKSREYFVKRLTIFIQKINNIIKQDRFEQYLGAYGIYMMFSMLDMVYLDIENT